MRAFIKIILLLATVFLGVVFALQNPHKVTVDYYFGRFEAPLSLVVFTCLLSGAVLGWLIAWVRSLAKLHKCRQLKKKLLAAEAEISNLRRLPIKDEQIDV